MSDKYEIIIEPEDEQHCGKCQYLDDRWTIGYGNFRELKWYCTLLDKDLNYKVKNLSELELPERCDDCLRLCMCKKVKV